MNIPIFLSSDNNYAPFVATTIASICDNTKSFCDFYILDGGIEEENKEKICQLKTLFNNFSIEFINIKNSIKNFSTSDRYASNTMYARFLIPLLKPDINRALYSDVDVIVVGDVSEMYNEELDDYIIGAIQAPFVDCKKITPFMHFSDKHVYFCSGNLLIDCKKWRDEGITQKLFNIYDKYHNVITSPDQDILNKCFDTKYKPLPKKYCVTEYHMDYYKKNLDILIRHYGLKIKPWNLNPTKSSSLFPDLQLFWDYAKKTSFYSILLQNVQDESEQKRILRSLQLEKVKKMGVKCLNKYL